MSTVSADESRTGRVPVMMDVARAAGVSQKTVSRVINNAPHVRDDVRKRVQLAIKDLGYRPNNAARALVTQRTHLIGTVAVGTRFSGPATRVLSLEHAARGFGYELAISSIPDSWTTEVSRAVENLLHRGAEGIVLEIPSSSIAIDSDALRDIPVISNVDLPAVVRRKAVIRFDQIEIGRIATRHLIDLGHVTIAHIAGPRRWDVSGARRQGWRRELRAHGLTADQVWQGDWSARSGYEIGKEIAANPQITAVFAANDYMAMGAIRALIEAGRYVPKDVSVIGIDDVPEAEFQVVPLSTVQSGQDDVSARILQEIVAMIEGAEPSAALIEYPPTLIHRRSSGPPNS